VTESTLSLILLAVIVFMCLAPIIGVIVLVRYLTRRPPGQPQRTVHQPPPPRPQTPFYPPAPVSTAQPTRPPSPQQFSTAPSEHPSDRWFPNHILAEGRRLAGNRCEHTDTRIGDRCKNYWQEGDHFYDYAKGGATSQRNLVGACKWHNNPTSRTMKRKDAEHEKLLIQERRKAYYPVHEDRTVGELRNTGLRLTFSVKSRVHRIESAEPSEVVAEVKEVLHYYAGPKAVTTRLNSISTFGQMFDYLWGMRKNGTYIENLEGIDPLTGEWASLRKPSEWAKQNPEGNR
jgi:hypothetical protein